MAKELKNVPEDLPIKTKNGDTLSIPMKVVDDAGALVDLDDYAIVAQVRKKRLSETIDASFIVVNKNNPVGFYWLVMDVDLPCGETVESPLSRYVWDVQLTNNGVSPATVKTTHAGTFLVEADVTRAP